MIKYFKFFILSTIVFLTCLTACNPEYETCGNYAIPNLRCGFSLADTSKPDTLVLINNGINDSVYNILSKKYSFVALNPDTGFTQFTINTKTLVVDTIFKIDSIYTTELIVIIDTVLKDTDIKSGRVLHVDTTIISIDSNIVKLTDIVNIYYKQQVKLNDIECGFVVDFSIDSILSTKNDIKKIEILNSVINQESIEHVKIYY